MLLFAAGARLRPAPGGAARQWAARWAGARGVGGAAVRGVLPGHAAARTCRSAGLATVGALRASLRRPDAWRARSAPLLRRRGSSLSGQGAKGPGAQPERPSQLDAWLGLAAFEAGGAPGDPWLAFRMRLAILVQFVCFLYILNNYGISSTLCQGPSMMPTLNPAGDVVLVEHVSATLNRLQRGDVVVAKSPTDPHAVVCKRILGLPGDKVPLPHPPPPGPVPSLRLALAAACSGAARPGLPRLESIHWRGDRGARRQGAPAPSALRGTANPVDPSCPFLVHTF